MKGNWGSAILLYVVSCVLYVPYGILNRGGAIAGLAVLLLIFVYLPINFGLLYGHEIEMYTVEQGEKRDKRQ